MSINMSSSPLGVYKPLIYACSHAGGVPVAFVYMGGGGGGGGVCLQ